MYSNTAKCVGKCQYHIFNNGFMLAQPFQYVTILIKFESNYTLVLGLCMLHCWYLE